MITKASSLFNMRNKAPCFCAPSSMSLLDKPLSEIVSADQKQRKAELKRKNNTQKQSQQRQQQFTQNRQTKAGGVTKQKQPKQQQKAVQQRQPYQQPKQQRQQQPKQQKGVQQKQNNRNVVAKANPQRKAAQKKVQQHVTGKKGGGFPGKRTALPSLQVTVTQNPTQPRNRNRNRNQSNNKDTTVGSPSVKLFQQNLLEAVRQTLPSLLQKDVATLTQQQQQGHTTLDGLFSSLRQ